MKFGKVLTYKDIEEAEKIIGKKVIHADSFKYIETRPDKWLRPTILTGVDKGDSRYYPFQLLDGTVAQFIREVLPDKPEYEPYDLSDPKVRDSLRGRWHTYKDNREAERSIDRFLISDGVWTVNDKTAEYFFKHCIWLDGTPCGQRVE